MVGLVLQKQDIEMTNTHHPCKYGNPLTIRSILSTISHRILQHQV